MGFSHHTEAQSFTIISIREAKLGELGTAQLELQPLSVVHPQPRSAVSGAQQQAQSAPFSVGGWVRADQSPQKTASSLTNSLLELILQSASIQHSFM